MHHTRPFAEMTADTEVQLRKKESRMIYNERHGIADVKLSKISTYEKYEKMFPLNIPYSRTNIRISVIISFFICSFYFK